MTRLAASVLDRLSVLLTPPSESRIGGATADFVDAVRARYGDGVTGCHLFGSHARGTAGPESDVDVAVVFARADKPAWQLLRELAGIAFEILVDHGVRIQAHPVMADDWVQSKTPFLAAIRRDAKRLP